MIHETFGSIALLAMLLALVGFVLGLAYFAALHRTAVLFATGGGWLGLSALTIGRIAAATILLTLAAMLGAAPLIATFLGFLLARAVALRRVG